MDEHVVGVTGIRIYSAKNRWNEMTNGLWLMRIGNIDSPEAGVLPGAENNIAFDHSFDIVNTKATTRAIGRAKAVQRKPESRNLNRIFLVANIQDMHVTERTLFRTNYFITRDDHIGSATVGRNHNANTVRVSFLGR